MRKSTIKLQSTDPNIHATQDEPVRHLLTQKVVLAQGAVTVALMLISIALASIALLAIDTHSSALAQSNDSSSQSSEEAANSIGTVKISANIHSAPRINAAVKRKAVKGDEVTILGSDESGTWLQIGTDEWIAALAVKVGEKVQLESSEAESEPTAADRDVDGDIEGDIEGDDAGETPQEPAKRRSMKLGDLLAKAQLSATPSATKSDTTTDTVDFEGTEAQETEAQETEANSETDDSEDESSVQSTSESQPESGVGAVATGASITTTAPITSTQVITTRIITVTRPTGNLNRDSNIRAGPGVSFDAVGRIDKGTEVQIIQQSSDGYWLEIDLEEWVAEFLVDITGQTVVTTTITETVTVELTATEAIVDLTGDEGDEVVVVDEADEGDEGDEEIDDSEPVAPEPLPIPERLVYANRSANLRGGPGTEFDVTGGVVEGAALTITGQNNDESWYYIDSGGIDTGSWIAAFLVADEPPPEPTPLPSQPEEVAPAAPDSPPTESAAPPASGNEFVVVSKRLWDVDENGGYLDGPSVHCGFKRELHVHVLDRNGIRMNGVQAQVVYGAKEIMVTGSQGIGDGVASFVLGKGQDVKIVRAPDGREVSSEIATGLVTEPQYIDREVLKAGRYCTDDASCESFVRGNGCYAHYSWTVTFQEQ